MQDIIIAPSVLSLDYSRMEDQIDQINASKAKWLHFDVMDGHFVPALTFGPEILKGFRKSCPLFMDVHLMVEHPENFVKSFADSGADLITFHVESLNNDPEKIRALIDLIHSHGIQAGFSIKPATPVEDFYDLLDHIDLVLVMSVEPGKGGQAFMPEQLQKVRWLKENRKDRKFRIEIDGGINDSTAVEAIKSGADTLVAGSYVFKNNIVEAVESLIND